MDKNLVAAVTERNASHIKSALTSITLKDPGFATDEFANAMRYVADQGINLYEPFDGEVFKPESEWDKDYWRYINVSLMDNFCRERILKLQEIGRKLYPVKAQAPTPPKQTSPPPRTTSSGIPKSPTGSRPRSSGDNGIPFPVKAVGALALVGVGCVTIGPPATLGIAAAGGAIAWLTNKH